LPLLFLLYHCYRFSITLLSTDAASLAIKEIKLRISLSIPFNATIRTKDIAKRAFWVAFTLI